MDRLAPTTPARLPDPEHAVRASLAQPLGHFDWTQVGTARSAAIVINDKTRWAPNQLLLPPLMEQLRAIGLTDEHIFILIASGLHDPMPAAEFAQVVPEAILNRYAVYAHDPDGSGALEYVGYTRRGTPVYCNRRLLAADLRIVVGVMEPHQFMGFSGGVKSAAIGLCGRETIRRNHELMRAAAARIGTYEQNPARSEVEEIGRMLAIDLALNIVVDDRRAIVAVYAGDPIAVMRAGIPRVLEVHSAAARSNYDLVITSPGGHPKDSGLYQAQKALTPATLVARAGAPIILVAACPDGSGDRNYEGWVRKRHSHAEVIERFVTEGFEIGPHKAFQFASAAAGRHLILVSDMPPDQTRSFLLSPADSIEAALAIVGYVTRRRLRIALLPYANSTLPATAT